MSDLTVRARAGPAGVEVSPPTGPFSELVSTAERPARGLRAWVLGDVHHRPDLARRLGVPAATPAAELVCLAYDRLGEGGLDLVEGPCSALISDQPAQALVAHRGRVGTEFPLYYSTTGRGAVVGSTLRAVVRDAGFTAWDPDYFAEYLNWAVPGYEPPTERTPLTGVSRVRPGTRVVLR